MNRLRHLPQAIQSTSIIVFLHIVLIHVLEQRIIGAIFLHPVLEKFHGFYAVHVCKELAHDPYAVGKSRGVKQVIPTCTLQCDIDCRENPLV